jgi:hypothetical protein
MYVNANVVKSLLGRRVLNVWELPGPATDNIPYVFPEHSTWLPIYYNQNGLTYDVERHSLSRTTTNTDSIRKPYVRLGTFNLQTRAKNKYFWLNLARLTRYTLGVQSVSLWVDFPRIIAVLYRYDSSVKTNYTDYYSYNFNSSYLAESLSPLALDNQGIEPQVKVKLDDDRRIVKA